MRVERWQNAETGEWYEVEYADAVEAPGPEPDATQLPDSTPDPIEPPRAVLDAPGPPIPDPRRVRLLARLMRSILERTDD